MAKTYFNKETLVWSGIGQPVCNYYTDKILGQSLLNSLNKPERVVQISDNNGYQMTNLEMYRKSIAVAKNLNKLGYNQKTVIGICSRNNHFLAPIVVGCIVNGVPINPIDSNYRQKEIVHMFGLTKPSAVFCEKENVPVIKKSLSILNVEIPIYVFHEKIDGCLLVEDLFADTDDNGDDFVASAVKDPDNEICVIVCSSGTTGLSKGVALSYSSLIHANSVQYANFQGTVLTWGTIYWIGMFSCLIGGIIQECLRIITTEPFSAQLAFEIIPKYRVTDTGTPPYCLALMLSHPAIETTDFSSLQRYMVGGSIVRNELIQQMNQYAPKTIFFNGYGMSESAATFAVNFPENRFGSVGQIIEGVQVKIIDNNYIKCGVNVEGEICFNSKSNFLGYYGMEEETKKVYDNDGFIYTGDIGYFDEDGYLYIVNRKKDIIKYRNNQIQPLELEEYILKNENVKMVCVVGIPDPICIDLPAAAIVKSDRGCEETIKDDINKMIKDTFKDDKQLRGGIYFLESLPLTSSGKFIRHEIKNIVTELYKGLHKQ